MIRIIVFSFLLLSMSCMQERENLHSSQTKHKNDNAILPAIPIEDLQKITDQGVSGDVLFHHIGITVGLNSKASVANSIQYITPLSTVPDNNCQADARIFYNNENSLLKEAEIYISGTCHYIAFLENGKATHASKLNKTGTNFYRNVMAKYYEAKKAQ